MAIKSADYVIVGGGLTGCVIASRLAKSGSSVILLEAGVDPSGNPNITTPLGGFALIGSELDYGFKTTPQATTENRVHVLSAAKCLGGGTAINFGGWLRADAADYDMWGETVGDKRWSYQGLLPWLKKSESFYDPSSDPDVHGFDGPVHVTSVSASDSNRNYPLREHVRSAWNEVGVKAVGSESGSLAGLYEFHENSNNGNRQTSYLAYSLDSVEVHTEKPVYRVVFDEVKNASGVETTDGWTYKAKKEVILCAGAYKTPQILMLSGIGPAATLKDFEIPILRDLPVGENLFDHFAIYLAFKLKNAERGLSLGSPKLEHPAFFKGLPCDWVVNLVFPQSTIKELVEEDAGGKSDFSELLVKQDRNLAETFTIYSPAGVPGVPTDGTHVATSTMLLLPTSRGRVSISSSSHSDPPKIDPGYFITELDRKALIRATRNCLIAHLGTGSLKDYIASEAPPSGPGIPDIKPLTLQSTDEEIDRRIRAFGKQHYHSGGTAAMGSVVDAEGSVLGVGKLRVADASAIPVPLGGHPQASLYAFAEQMANMIIQGA